MSGNSKATSPHSSGDRLHNPSPHHKRRGQGSYRHGHRGRGHHQRSRPEQSEVDALFNKSFTFQKPGDPWRLPSRDEMFADKESTSEEGWNQSLNDLRSKLRSVQDHLSDKEILEWHRHTSSTHRGGLVMPEVKKRFHVELGTQAWCKFHEIVATRHLIPESAFTSGTLHSLHICEAPGAFISSLNHYIKTHRDKEITQWKWLGTSLNPHCETNTPDCTIVDDRLILQTPDCWYFGEDNTGDVMSATNLAGLERLVEERMNGAVHLVTADGSVNCQNDPEHQEQRVFPLLFCQSLTALQILSPEGAFLIKMFTMYNANTACLMYLLNCAFEEVTVVKPTCSKAGNSEVYVICKSFLGRNKLKPQLETLVEHFGSDMGNTSFLNPAYLPNSFVTQLVKCSQKFTSYQMAAIEENLSLYPKIDESSQQQINQVRELCVETFIRRCRLRVARKHQKLMPNYGLKTSSMFSKNIWNRLHGSLEEREEAGHRSWREQLLAIQRSLQQPGANGDPSGDHKESSPKKMRSSNSSEHHQDGREHRGSKEGLVESHGDLSPEKLRPGLPGQTSQNDPELFKVGCHGDGSHVGEDGDAMETLQYRLGLPKSVEALATQTSTDATKRVAAHGDNIDVEMGDSVTEAIAYKHGTYKSVEALSAQTNTGAADPVKYFGDDVHVGANDVQMIAQKCERGLSNSVESTSGKPNGGASRSINCHKRINESAMETCNLEQISSAQTNLRVAGIVGEVATLDVCSHHTPSGCAKSFAVRDGSAGVNHTVSSHTAKPNCDESTRTRDPDCLPCSADNNGFHGNSVQVSHKEKDGPIESQLSTPNGNNQCHSTEMIKEEIPWITPGKQDCDSLSSWKIMKGKPLRAVFMSSFCEMQLLDKWRTVRMNAKVLQKSVQHNVKGHQHCDLSPKMLKVIKDQLSKRPSSNQKEWYCYGFDSPEINKLQQIAASHASVVVGSAKIDEDLIDDIEGMHRREGDQHRRFKSLFIKLVPSCTQDNTEPTAAELDIKQDFISSCLLAVKVLQTGGSLHIWVPALLTRFSASIIYALSQTFDLLTLVRDQRSDGLAAPPVLINGTGFYPNQQVQKNIQSVYDEMKELHHDGIHDVLQFIPMSSLFNPDFDTPLTRFNEALLKDDLLDLVKAELALLDDKHS